jgi:hypothetical protein
MFDFPSIYEEIVARAGGEQSTAEDVLKVERGVRLVLQRWANQRYPTWRVTRVTLTASGYTDTIPMPTDVDDILQASVVNQDGSKVLDMTRVPGSRFMQMGNRSLEGTPSQFWLNRAEPPELMIYPCGIRGRVTLLALWVVATPPEWTHGDPGVSVVPQRWLEALIVAGAHDLASKRPAEGGTYDETLIARLKVERAEAEKIALDADRDRAHFSYRINL